MSEASQMITVSGLFCYPLKGGRGIEVAELVLDDFGPAGDRRWMVVGPDGGLITQREVARLCQVGATPSPDGLRLEAPGVAPLVAPAPPPNAPVVTVRVWNDRCTAVDLGAGPAGWLSAWLGQPCRLVYMPDSARRVTDPDYDPVGSRVSFADGYPILLAGGASLAALNAKLDAPLPMNRFRPNVVVRGAGPFDEDEWRRFRIAGLRFDAVKPCARCQVPTIDQETAEAGREPSRTLATFRKRGSSVLFGVNVAHRDRGVIRLGDPVAVESRGRPPIARR